MGDNLSTLNPNSYFHLLSFRESKKIAMDLEDDFFIEQVEDDASTEEKRLCFHWKGRRIICVYVILICPSYF